MTEPTTTPCSGYFERRTRGKRYVNARWHCKRKAVKGTNYCSYCGGWQARQERITAKNAKRDAEGR